LHKDFKFQGRVYEPVTPCSSKKRMLSTFTL